MPDDVYKLVLQAASVLDNGQGGTIREMYTYIRENGCVRLNDKELGLSIRDALKRGIEEGVLKQDYCTKKYYAVTPVKKGYSKNKRPAVEQSYPSQKRRKTDPCSSSSEDEEEEEDDENGSCSVCESDDSDCDLCEGDY